MLVIVHELKPINFVDYWEALDNGQAAIFYRSEYQTIYHSRAAVKDIVAEQYRLVSINYVQVSCFLTNFVGHKMVKWQNWSALSCRKVVGPVTGRY